MGRHRRARRTAVAGASQFVVVLVLVGVVGLVAVQAFARAAPSRSAEVTGDQVHARHPGSVFTNPTPPVIAPATPLPGMDPIVVPLPTVNASVWMQRGEIISDEPLIDLAPSVLDLAGEARRATYRSVSGISGVGTEVSGAFFIPKGTPPPTGWQVVSLAHSTTGLNTECGPSLRSDLFGLATAVEAMLSYGYAVALTDYEGLGGPGIHPYLEPRTEGFNVIDAVRALRSLFPTVSPQWLALGHSQGGQAAWAANEVDKFYGGGLDFRGSVALAPGTNLSELAYLAYDGQLSLEQLAVMPLAVMAAQRTFSEVPVESLLHGEALRLRGVLIGCGPETDQARATVLNVDDVKPTSRSDADSLAEALRKLALPQEPLSAPMFVMSGLKDELVLPSWISSAVARSCRLGGQIYFLEVGGAAHGQVGPDHTVISWMVDRFAGNQAASNCRNG